MKRIITIGAAMAALLSFNSPATAQEMDSSSYVSVGTGVYDIGGDDEAADFRLEYRSGNPLFWLIHPWGGAEVTSDGSIWAGGGVLADIGLSPEIYLIPSFGIGVYDDGDSGIDLDYPIEFRSQLELAYQFQNEHRLGMSFGHISNAGLGDDNPGTEILSVYWHIPTNSLTNGF